LIKAHHTRKKKKKTQNTRTPFDWPKEERRGKGVKNNWEQEDDVYLENIIKILSVSDVLIYLLSL